ncbi:hypothetical protein EMCG_01848, partial [[Emmonsia] crescens]
MPTMPTPSANGMITMTAADLLAFCQQMMMATHQNPDSNNDSGTPVNEQKQEIREYQKEVQTLIDMKTVTTFDGTNYQAWKVGILADAEVIGGTDILMKNEQAPPEGLAAPENEH